MIEKEIAFDSDSESELILKAYAYYGKEICKLLNGVFTFAIWNEEEKELFVARDRFGIKPLYYAARNGNFIFSSEIKAILAHPNVKCQIDEKGIGELFGIGPAHSPGKTPFKDIYELEPAHFLVLNREEFYKKEYWKLTTKFHSDDLETTCSKIRNLIVDSTKLQLNSEVPICTLLSGGLDSSIMTLIASNYYKEKGEKLKTFSVDYIDQEKNFVKNDFQPDLDMKYIELMIKKCDTDHTKILLDTPALYDSLKDAMIARDFPGMADVDSSYLLLFKEVSKHASIAISGECSDEIFGGYPWYFREEALESRTFPWSLAIEERQKILNSRSKC